MKVTFILIVLAALLGFGLVAAAKADSAPAPAASVQASAPTDADPLLIWKRSCWTGVLLVSNPRNQPDQNWTDAMCMTYDLSHVNWLEVCGPEPEYFITTPITSWGMLQARCWQRQGNP